MSRRPKNRRSPRPLERVPQAFAFTPDGVPIYDGTTLEVAEGTSLGGEPDHRLLLGVGPSGGQPVAYVLICPCEGARGLIRDLQDHAAHAMPHHAHHPWPGSITGAAHG